MRLSLIAAVAANRVIGYRNSLPWRLPADLKHFKRLTMGHHLIMGRKTFESIGRPLPGRTIIVLSRNRSFLPGGLLLARSLDEALALARSDDEPFVAGGEAVFRLALDRADRIYLTEIHHEFAGDTFFPDLDLSRWSLVSREDHSPDEENPWPFSFLIYDRTEAGRGSPREGKRVGEGSCKD